jgi:hypothetical protein
MGRRGRQSVGMRCGRSTDWEGFAGYLAWTGVSLDDEDVEVWGGMRKRRKPQKFSLAADVGTWNGESGCTYDA